MIPLSDSHSSGRFPFWILVIIAINIYVFYLQITSPDSDQLIASFALIPSLIDFGSPDTLMRFVTYQFLHGGFLHIISNMLFLWVFGDNVEARMGEILFPIFYLFCGVVAALTEYVFISDLPIPMIGASGAAAGVMGAYFAWFRHHKIRTLVPIFIFLTIINIPAYFMLFYWFAVQVLSSAVMSNNYYSDVGGIAYYAHIGGFIFGWVFAKLLSPKGSDVLEEVTEV